LCCRPSASKAVWGRAPFEAGARLPVDQDDAARIVQPVGEVADAGEGPSLAVLGDKPEVAPLVSLVEVELSKSGLRLVERAALDRMLREQELNTARLAESPFVQDFLR